MNLLIRADAGAGIGAGHVTRCFALAQAWVEAGGSARFLMASGAETFSALFHEAGLACDMLDAGPGTPQDALATAAHAKAMAADWIVLDGYSFGPAYQLGLRDAEAKVLVVDDNGECAHGRAEMVLNQNLHAMADWYDLDGGAPRLLLGPSYALLRSRFRGPNRPARRASGPGARILISMGGADPENLTVKAIEACSRLDVAGLEIIAVAGAMNPRLRDITDRAERAPAPIQVRKDVSDMAGLMAWADVALIAAGSTVWELLSMGVPTLAMAAADNQRGIAGRLGEIGAIENLGWHDQADAAKLARKTAELLADHERRNGMSALGKRLVDGEGAPRVVRAMQSGNRG